MSAPHHLRRLLLPLLLLFQGLALGAFLDNVQLSPTTAPVGTAATVRATAQVTDPTVIATH